MDILLPSFYPTLYATNNPSSAPCNKTDTPEEDRALYAANVKEAVRLRDKFHPEALVLPYAGWYSDCPLPSEINIKDEIVLPKAGGADGIVIFGSTGGPFPTPDSLAKYLNSVWGPLVQNTSSTCKRR
eukprot:NODE_2516_length_470_cov_94.766571_g2499_i0.p1 GENE.NODE_2516_length_470_cov_94.766571_g2499_i0~~NODE_2516_length_470_cov_94.766571_g2499_i0.p1  ORF type:complete len:138 (+),score=11.51 NODE_2516_length_470_cov_94.766571_g2499_i0:32-415(+)